MINVPKWHASLQFNNKFCSKVTCLLKALICFFQLETWFKGGTAKRPAGQRPSSQLGPNSETDIQVDEDYANKVELMSEKDINAKYEEMLVRRSSNSALITNNYICSQAFSIFSRVIWIWMTTKRNHCAMCLWTRRKRCW